MKYIIISQPKSGTYLCASLLQELEIKFTGYHLNASRYQKYENNKKVVDNNVPFVNSIKLINENEVAVTHINAKPQYVNALKDFKKIVLSRPFDERVKSWQRWQNLKDDEIPRKLLSYQNEWEQYNWNDQSDCFFITFDNLIKKDCKTLDRLQLFLFDKIKHNSIDIMNIALSKNTLTKHKSRL